MVEETFVPGMTVSLVARRHGVAPNQLFTWRRLVAQGSLTAAGSGEEVVPASDYRALQNQVRGASSAAWQEDPGSRDSQGGSRTRHGPKKRVARPVCKGFVQGSLISRRQRIRWEDPRPRWRSARPSPHKQYGIIAPFFLIRVPGHRSTVRPSRFFPLANLLAQCDEGDYAVRGTRLADVPNVSGGGLPTQVRCVPRPELHRGGC